MAGNRHLPLHVKFLFLVALSSAAASITLLQPYLALSFSDLAAAGAFWWAAAQISTVHSTAQDQWRQDTTAMRFNAVRSHDWFPCVHWLGLTR
jgi:hypothetical protein